jgi:hypothetical protein
VSTGRYTDLDCLSINFGAYKICDATQKLSIDSSLLMLMTQALISRIVVPGVSNFVNASVRHLRPPACGSMSVHSRGNLWRFRGVSAHSPQVLHAGSNDGMGETSGMEACADEECSKQAVTMTPA